MAESTFHLWPMHPRATTRDKKLDGASNPQSKQTTRALYSTALTAKVTWM
ncbi:hypothetical protein D8B26_005156 [Coccidioides posadasii str. Silveira]|nr:hypothetical protein D8B26_005156 [Coccidioides posadasii str. Silveira]